MDLSLDLLHLAGRSLSLVGFAFAGTFFWPMSPEGASVYYVTVSHWSPPGVAALAATGQAIAAVVLFGAGGQLRRRWGWFDRKCQAAQARLGEKMARRHWVVAAMSGLFGLPPLSVTSALAPGLGIPFRRFLPLLFLARFARFIAITTVFVWLRGVLAPH